MFVCVQVRSCCTGSQPGTIFTWSSEFTLLQHDVRRTSLDTR